MGSRREAFMAGHMPKNKPMLTEAAKPTMTDQRGTAEGQPNEARIRKAEAHGQEDSQHAAGGR